jgi:hypothetical protein
LVSLCYLFQFSWIFFLLLGPVSSHTPWISICMSYRPRKQSCIP